MPTNQRALNISDAEIKAAILHWLDSDRPRFPIGELVKVELSHSTNRRYPFSAKVQP